MSLKSNVNAEINENKRNVNKHNKHKNIETLIINKILKLAEDNLIYKRVYLMIINESYKSKNR